MTTRPDTRSSLGALSGEPTIVVAPGFGYSMDIDVRGHGLVADQRHESVELERGPEPIELLVAGLAACVTTCAAAYLRRHGLGTSGLSATASFSVGGRPASVTEISIRLTLPPQVPVEHQAPLLATARHCTAHNTLITPPTIDIELA